MNKLQQHKKMRSKRQVAKVHNNPICIQFKPMQNHVKPYIHIVFREADFMQEAVNIAGILV